MFLPICTSAIDTSTLSFLRTSRQLLPASSSPTLVIIPDFIPSLEALTAALPTLPTPKIFTEFLNGILLPQGISNLLFNISTFSNSTKSSTVMSPIASNLKLAIKYIIIY